MSETHDLDDHGDVVLKKSRCEEFEESQSGSESDDEAGLEDLVFGGCGVVGEKNIDEGCGFFIDKGPSVGAKSGAAWYDDDDNDETLAETEESECPTRGLGNMMYQPLHKANRRKEFEKALGEAPSWSLLDSTEHSKDDEELLTISHKYVTKSEHLPKTTLDINKRRDLNQQGPSERNLKACEFHKTAQIGLTASVDCRLHLFQVDGKSNPKIHSFYVEEFPIQCSHFLTSREEIVMTSTHPYYYSYDMIGGKVTRIGGIKGTDNCKLRGFKVSPGGEHLLFLSHYGYMHLVSSKTKELINTFKINGDVCDAAFSNSGKHILAFGDEGKVAIWDIRSQLCMHSFADEGCTSGTSLAISADEKYVACGSESGMVNLYDERCFSEERPKPIKAFKNLRTSVSQLAFNHNAEILAMSSAGEENAIRLAHMRSRTVFSNFPGFENSYLGFAKLLDFSCNSGYLAIGGSRGRAFLFRLEHYKSY